MSKTIKLMPPLTDADVEPLEIGDKVLVSGVIYTARDAAHKRLLDLLEAGKPLPMEIKGQILYYVGPSPARPGSPGPQAETDESREEESARRHARLLISEIKLYNEELVERGRRDANSDARRRCALSGALRGIENLDPRVIERPVLAVELAAQLADGLTIFVVLVCSGIDVGHRKGTRGLRNRGTEERLSLSPHVSKFLK